jgi:AbrB family looped-hinge helix DNA binding protein
MRASRSGVGRADTDPPGRGHGESLCAAGPTGLQSSIDYSTVRVRARYSNEDTVFVHGIFYGMKTTIDSAGRIVIPKEIRRQAGIEAGALMEVRLREGCIEIEPAPAKMKLERRGRLMVAVPNEPVPPLTAAVVEKTRQKLRRERESD